MKLTTEKIIHAIFFATIRQLPRAALLAENAGYTLTPDDSYWMDKAIRIPSARRQEVRPGLTNSRLHSLARQNHIQIEPAGHGFTFSLPEEHLGKCWFRTRELLSAAGVPSYGDEPRPLDLKTVTERVSIRLAREYYVTQSCNLDGLRWRILSYAETGMPYLPINQKSTHPNHD